jgi:hypothetical protein
LGGQAGGPDGDGRGGADAAADVYEAQVEVRCMGTDMGTGMGMGMGMGTASPRHPDPQGPKGSGTRPYGLARGWGYISGHRSLYVPRHPFNPKLVSP